MIEIAGRDSLERASMELWHSNRFSQIAIIPPSFLSRIQDIDGFTPIRWYPPQVGIYSREVGSIANFRFLLDDRVEKMYCILVHGDEEDLVERFIEDPLMCPRVLSFPIYREEVANANN